MTGKIYEEWESIMEVTRSTKRTTILYLPRLRDQWYRKSPSSCNTDYMNRYGNYDPFNHVYSWVHQVFPWYVWEGKKIAHCRRNGRGLLVPGCSYDWEERTNVWDPGTRASCVHRRRWISSHPKNDTGDHLCKEEPLFRDLLGLGVFTFRT